jgi:CBS domain-containing protein
VLFFHPITHRPPESAAAPEATWPSANCTDGLGEPESLVPTLAVKFRNLFIPSCSATAPVLDAGKVVGMISIGDVVKDIIRNLEHNVGDLMGYIMTDGPGG